MFRFTLRRASVGDAESGFGLVEIIVCIFLIGIVGMAFLPIMVQGLQLSAKNATVAFATQQANEQLDMARVSAPTCAGLRDYVGRTPGVITDTRNNRYTTKREIGACPTSYPGTIRVTASVALEGSSETLAEMTTYVRLAAAS